MRARAAIRDFRALGSAGAPLRAVYEVSKRLGTHRIVFGYLAHRHDAAPMAMPLPRPTTVPAGAAARALSAASNVAAGRVRLFGREIDVGERPDWHWAIENDNRWPCAPWWTIDVRSPKRVADVKWAWELGRHHHLVKLARGIRLDSANPIFRRVLTSHLETWIDQNPLEQGIHWYSNLEIAIRSIAWLQIIGLAGHALHDSLLTKMQRILYHSARHLVADLPYTVSTMRNNHLLGDSLGLIALGKAFAGDRRAALWTRIGEGLFRKQLRREFNDDGSTIEDSLSYHRFVMDMLALRLTLGGAEASFYEQLVGATQYLVGLGVLEGEVPQFGDWDEGRVLTVDGNASDFAGIVRLATALVGSGATTESQDEHDETAWYASFGTPSSRPSEAASERRGKIAKLERGPFRAWLKFSSGTYHGHSDLGSVVVEYQHRWVVGDPGTGTYNGPLEQRNYFRSSLAHSVLRIDGLDELEPHRAFRWAYEAVGLLGEPASFPDGVVEWGIHDAYTRLDPPTRVARVVVANDERITVVDSVQRPAGRTYALSIPLHPEVSLRNDKLQFRDGTSTGLALPSPAEVRRGQLDPYDGWWSDTYGNITSAERIEVAGPIEGPIAWQVSTPNKLDLDVRDKRVRAGPVVVEVIWNEHTAELRLSDGHSLTTRQLSWE